MSRKRLIDKTGKNLSK